MYIYTNYIFIKSQQNTLTSFMQSGKTNSQVIVISAMT